MSGIWAEVRPVETAVAQFVPAGTWSGIWAEVRPVETSERDQEPRGHQSGIWAEVRPVETDGREVDRNVLRPEYGPKSGPLRLALDGSDDLNDVRNMGRSQAR